MIKKGLAISCLFIMLLGVVRAQEEIGVVIDNYTPVNGMLLNPSIIADQRPWLDIHIMGLGFFYRSNFMYWPNSILTSPGTINDLAFVTDRSRNWIQFQGMFMGPSASLSLGKNAFGFHVASRALGNSNRMPTELVREISGDAVSDQFVGLREVRRARIKGTGWTEIGLSYARMIYNFDRDLVTVGGTIKRYIGHGYGSFIAREAALNVESLGSSFISAEGQAGYAPPALRAGGGWGMSIGITYKKMLGDVTHYIPHGRAERCVTIPYRFKLSVALADVGYIRYRQGAQVAEYSDAQDATDLVSNLSFSGYSTDGLSFEDRSFTTTPPWALTTQFDYNYSQGIFFNALWVQRIARPSGFWGERANYLAFTPRIERKYFSLGLPLSLVNYSAPQVGFFFRISGLSIGTDNLTSYIIQSDMYAADIYFHFRIPFNRSRKCKTSDNNAGPGFRFKDLFQWHNPTIEACPEW